MSWTLKETDDAFVLERRGHITHKLTIDRAYFAGLTDAEKMLALLAAMERLDDHARAASLCAGPDGVDVIAGVPPCASSR